MDILFDLDGTLSDPALGMTRTLQHALRELGRDVPPADTLLRFIGPPLREVFPELLGTSDTATIEHAISVYRARYGPIGLFENVVYDGIPALLERLAGGGRRLWIASSKPAPFVRTIVAHFGLAHHFRGMHGAELDGRFDDKRELLAHLVAHEGVVAGEAVMIGDRARDVLAATANGMRAIGVTWGYGSEQELREAGASVLCATPAELADAILAAP